MQGGNAEVGGGEGEAGEESTSRYSKDLEDFEEGECWRGVGHCEKRGDVVAICANRK